MIDRIKQWLKTRAGVRDGLSTGKPMTIPGAASWSRALGPMLVGLLILQLVTGVAMAFFYSPSTTDAWASVVYLEQEVALGSFLRALHHWGMDALVAVAVLHLIATFLSGAYKKPRELTWLLGLGALLVLLGFSLTGFILAYDAKGLAANQIETEIMASIPLVGPLQRELLIGGNDYGNLSLTRFYALHVYVLPALMLALVVGHIALVRKHGPAPRPWLRPEDTRRAVPWWPNQALRDAIGMLVGVGIVAVLAATYDAPLHAPADPSGTFDARPEWYFMPLYEARKPLSGGGELLATVALPGLAVAFLALVPFLDRDPDRHPRQRLRFVVPFCLGLLGFAALATLGLLADANNEAHQKAMKAADAKADRALELAQLGGVPLNPNRLIENDPVAWGEQIFDAECATCHSVGKGDGTAPDLAGWGSRAWLERFLSNPNHPHLYGGTDLACQMLPIESYGVEDEAAVKAIVDGLLARRGDHAPSGLPEDTDAQFVEAFDDGGCQGCHYLDLGEEPLGNPESLGPHLDAYGSPEWIDEMLLFPNAPSHYGDLNEMPTFAPKLDRDEREAVRAYLLTLADVPLSEEPGEEAIADAKEACAGGGDDTDDDGDATARDDARSAASIQAGRALFESRCSSCHVVDGEGTKVGPVLTGWGSTTWVTAFLSNPDHELLYGDTDLEGEMPPATGLGLEDRENIEFLVRAILIRRQGTSPALETALAERAIEIFDDSSCGACHQFEIGGESIGAADGAGPVLTGYASREWFHGLLEDPGAETYYGDNNAMPPFDDLSDVELESLTLYMMSLADGGVPAELDEAAREMLAE